MKTFLVAFCCLLCASCSVYSASNVADNKGIPVLVRKPVQYQVTKVSQVHWQVQYSLAVDGKSHLAPEVALEVVASPEALDALRQIGNDLASERGLTVEQFKQGVSDRLKAKSELWGGCTPGSAEADICVRPANRYAKVLENRIEVVSELSTEQYYINTNRPWIGSSSATIKLAADGTMTEAHSEIEDKTIETIASLLPVTAYFTKQWDLVDIAAESTGNKGGVPTFGAREIEMVLTPVNWSYVLRKKLSSGDELKGPLSYPGACGTATGHCVEIASAAKAGTGTKDAEKQEGWTVSGTLIPPKGK